MSTGEQVGPGRPSIGVTKKVSITLKEKEWEALDAIQKDMKCTSRSALLRKILRNTIYCGLQEWFDPSGE